MEGLKDEFKDEEERYKWIVEEMMYCCDINLMNTRIVKMILDPCQLRYSLNVYTGDTLALNTEEIWGVKGFDLLVGNPPYQRGNGNKGRGNTLWDKFVMFIIDTLLQPRGYLCIVHQCGWRQLNHPCGKKILSRQLLTLNMNDHKKGQVIFKCATTYDWYVLENTEPYKDTSIDDWKSDIYHVNLKHNKFIPNHSFNKVHRILTLQQTGAFVCDTSSYETRRKWMSKECEKESTYPCVYSINKKNELSLN